VLTAISTGVAAALLVVAAVAAGRGYRKRGPALTAGGFAIAYAAACGAVAVGGDSRVWDFGAPQILVAACAAALTATVLVLTLGDGVSGFVAVVVTGLLTALGTAISAGTDLTAPATAAVIATAALALSPMLPMLSFRLSRLPLPEIPTDATDLMRDTGRVDSAQILGQAVRADQFLTGLVGGAALSIAGAAVIITGRGPSEYVLAVALGLVCLLRARLFTGRDQRFLLLFAGGAALLATAVAGVLDADGTGRLLAFAIPAAAAALLFLGLAVTLPGRRYAPPWSRSADIVESLLVLSIIPLALGVMGVYGAIRHAAS
jgi:type VII secretion integral membrane protein EccD